jgi:hypothetical protein
MTEHTPGPWNVTEVCFNSHGEPLRQIEAETVMVAEVYADFDEGMENARLIAAAPELLAACQAFIAADNQCGANLAFVMAQEAVRKAVNHEHD